MPDPAFPPPLLSLPTVVRVLSRAARWSILRELADGGSLMVSELSSRTGYAPDIVSRHLKLLRESGIVQNPRGRLYEMVPRYLADPANRILDLGWCLIRLNADRPPA